MSSPVEESETAGAEAETAAAESETAGAESETASASAPVAPRGRGRPKGVKDSKPRAPRGSKAQAAATEGSMLAYAAPVEEAEEVSPLETPPAEEEANPTRSPTRSPKRSPKRIPIASARPDRPERRNERRASSPKRKRKAPQRTREAAPAVSPPLSYLEVMTRAMAAARTAERDAKSARYDAFFQRR
jgi:hypothetical protein